MTYVPHSSEQQKQMCEALGIKSVDELFDEIPSKLLVKNLPEIPQAMNEWEVRQLLRERSQQDAGWQCYLGGGAYEHHIPAPVWHIAARGEYLTSYTPYQAECSQGTLQLLYEFQTMMASLMGLPVSNASLYDGATSITEAVLMCVRHLRKQKHHTIWVPEVLSPQTHEVLKTLLDLPEISIKRLPCPSGRLSLETLSEQLKSDEQAPSALVVAQPNYLGQLEEVDALTDWAHANDIMLIANVNPLSMALLKPPGRWGKQGADIACGEAQPFGIPLASGGPYLGFICSTTALIRQLPGRIVGQTQDSQGRRAFCLTLQAREQHIRRAKATSNVCTNQGLLVTAATIYLSLMGPEGLKSVAMRCHLNAQRLQKALASKGITCAYSKNYFHELVLPLPIPSSQFLKAMEKEKILAGIPIEHIPTHSNAVLVCVTETKSEQQIKQYAQAVATAIKTKSLEEA
ncbi:MAG: aminomethyl-transferring glycine dehydrogenase [Legionellales bacterium]|nr:aminomethyl-transferring glycine dehydrogenase [Legionellales bacterium]